MVCWWVLLHCGSSGWAMTSRKSLVQTNYNALFLLKNNTQPLFIHTTTVHPFGRYTSSFKLSNSIWWYSWQKEKEPKKYTHTHTHKIQKRRKKDTQTIRLYRWEGRKVGPPLHFPFARVNQQPTSAPWRMDDKWSGNNFLLSFSSP